MSGGLDAFDRAFEGASPMEYGEQGQLLEAEETRSGLEPERSVNVHLDSRGAFEAFAEEVPVDLYLNTDSFWWPSSELPEWLVGDAGMEFGPPPKREEDVEQGGLFGGEEWWEPHWRGMPAFEQEDERPWKTIEVKFAREEDLDQFERDVLDGNSIYHGKWTWYPFRPYEDWTDRVWAGGEGSPRHPIYVISKGRSDDQRTSKALDRMGVPHRVVVEPQEADAYAETVGREKLLVLPFSDLGQGSIPARNWVWAHAAAEGHDWHWILDDNLEGFYRLHQNAKRLVVDGAAMFRAAEEFVDRYRKVGVAGFQYESFAMRRKPMPPFQLNTRIYSCILLRTDLPFWWRGRYNEDTDLCLRALKDGWRTVLFNAFLANKVATMRMEGGNTDSVYAEDDGRFEFAKSLEERHPELVNTTRKWGRWHHDVDYSRFRENRLRTREGVDLSALPETDEHGMELIEPRGPQ